LRPAAPVDRLTRRRKVKLNSEPSLLHNVFLAILSKFSVVAGEE
jgi:hypothetical protein